MKKSALITGSALLWLASCVTVKEATLFLPAPAKEKPFHSSAEIFSDQWTSEGWKTKTFDYCISIEVTNQSAYKGKYGIDIQWNAQGKDCPWIGFGFGWDVWTGKNLKNILNEGALEFWVRMESGERDNLPWAFGFEDFTGAQAWLGMSTNAIKGAKISTDWVRVELPLSEFNWREQNADPANIKQLIIQTQASGRVFIDEFRLVPYQTGYRNRATVLYLEEVAFSVDGKKNDPIWEQNALKIGNHSIRLQVTDDYLHIAADIQDTTPLQNSKSKEAIWDGDGLEIAFSTDPNLSRTRAHYFSTDQHIGFGFGHEIQVWNFRTGKAVKMTETATEKHKNGYVFEGKINIGELSQLPFLVNQLYGLEIAVNEGTVKGRNQQVRWNDNANEGFNQTPFRWGELYIVKQGHPNLP